VENMRHGWTPNEAAADAVRQISRYYPNFKGAVIAVSKNGSFGASCHGLPDFTFCIRNDSVDRVQLITVPCV